MNLKGFDPNSAASSNGIFGLPFSEKDARIVLIPVPWEATTSYGGGTSKGPAAILKASYQVDLHDPDLGHFYENGIAMLKESSKIKAWNKEAKQKAQKIIKKGGQIKSKSDLALLNRVNRLSLDVNQWVYTETKKYLDQGRIVGIVGGDHSVPLGAIKAYCESFSEMGILHFDAHADLRIAYEGFEHSHASIIFNLLKETSVNKIVQVGIRDLCEQEKTIIDENGERLKCFFDSDLKQAMYSGKSWDNLCDEIVYSLPKEVYVSFDIDGLDPRFCPSTGTPVPGGFDFDQAVHVLRRLVASGRKIIGFDLNEVAPGATEWDANVGARMLFKLCGWTLKNA